MTALTEEKLNTVSGGTEELVNGSSGGGYIIHAGDWVTWNGHENMGKGYVEFVIFGYAYVMFYIRHTPIEHFVSVLELTRLE